MRLNSTSWADIVDEEDEDYQARGASPTLDDPSLSPGPAPEDLMLEPMQEVVEPMQEVVAEPEHPEPAAPPAAAPAVTASTCKSCASLVKACAALQGG